MKVGRGWQAAKMAFIAVVVVYGVSLISFLALDLVLGTKRTSAVLFRPYLAIHYLERL